MRKKEKESLARVAGTMGRAIYITLEAYHLQQCLNCPHNPDSEIKKEAPKGQKPGRDKGEKE